MRSLDTWEWMMNDMLPEWVKKNYLPNKHAASKPFCKEDVRFFSKGIEELSAHFTTDRPEKLGDYLAHPRFRSSYLLYFLPLQSAKFLTLFEAELPKMGKPPKHIKVLDLGAGPGTASIAFLLYLHATRAEFESVELTWVDTQGGILRDGKAITEILCNSFPSLADKVTIKTRSQPWYLFKPTETYDLILAGHVLNESSKASGSLARMLPHSGQFGVLLVEPASRTDSQRISRLRDEWLESGYLPEKGAIWAPCTHSGVCPMGSGRDWCHTSIPIELPGKWFKAFSVALGSERHWLKMSYLWASGKGFPAKPYPSGSARVLSDPIGETVREVLLCQPEYVERLEISRSSDLRRGDLYIGRKP